jgi:hypothetical protein
MRQLSENRFKQSGDKNSGGSKPPPELKINF